MGANQPLTYPNEQIHCVIPPVNGIGGLFISSIKAARDTVLLQNLGIKAVLTSCYEASDLKYDQNIVPYHLFIEGRDDYLFNIYDHFDPCVDWISQHIRFTNVLVHCIGGKSRSASLVLAYLIREKGMSYEDSLNYVKGIRKIVKPNLGFDGQLKQYQNSTKNTRVMRPLSLNNITINHSIKNPIITPQPLVYRSF